MNVTDKQDIENIEATTNVQIKLTLKQHNLFKMSWAHEKQFKNKTRI